MQDLILKKNEERRLLAGHLWIYSNEIATGISPLKNFSSGELVAIKTASGKNLGVGYVNPHTLLSARLLTRNPNEKIDCSFFIEKIMQAKILREIYFSQGFYRLIFGESDGLPGLIVDRFDGVFVVQLNTAGMENLKNVIIEALVSIFKPRAILLRNDSSIRATENLPSYVEVVYGELPEEIKLIENNIKFCVSVKEGQKTGWFYDQRTNRARLAAYVKDKDVLDVFSYSGGFGVSAAAYGAKNVTCVDASAFALSMVKQNAILNNVDDRITTICEDAFTVLQDLQNSNKLFDVIILDPPAFIKRRKDADVGMAAYQRVHRLALRILRPNGILLTTSCSLHLSRDMLLDVCRKACLQENRTAVVLEQLHQACDHPVHPAILETNYLKGFALLLSR